MVSMGPLKPPHVLSHLPGAFMGATSPTALSSLAAPACSPWLHEDANNARSLKLTYASKKSPSPRGRSRFLHRNAAAAASSSSSSAAAALSLFIREDGSCPGSKSRGEFLAASSCVRIRSRCNRSNSSIRSRSSRRNSSSRRSSSTNYRSNSTCCKSSNCSTTSSCTIPHETAAEQRLQQNIHDVSSIKGPFACDVYNRLYSNQATQLASHAPSGTPLLVSPEREHASLLVSPAADSAPCSAAAPPPLLLAPMENLADSRFRRAFHEAIGGFDEACTEFIRIPDQPLHPAASVRGVLRQYDGRELQTTPLGAQIMGSNPETLRLAARMLSSSSEGCAPDLPGSSSSPHSPQGRRRLWGGGAPRVDLNCGCPANTVTGKGAGSSLLRDPNQIFAAVASMAAGIRDSGQAGVALSVKMRTGFADTSLFEENLLAIQEGGASFVTIHGRTRQQGYAGSADWGLIARAKSVLKIPVIGNGDVATAGGAEALVRAAGCDGIMIGRGAVSDPFIFHRIKAHWAAQRGGQAGYPFSSAEEAERICRFLSLLTRADESGSDGCDGQNLGNSESSSGGGGGSGSGRRDKIEQQLSLQSVVAAHDVREMEGSCASLGGGGGVTVMGAEEGQARQSRQLRLKTIRGQSKRLKQVVRYLFTRNENLQASMLEVLRHPDDEFQQLLEIVCSQVRLLWC